MAPEPGRAPRQHDVGAALDGKDEQQARGVADDRRGVAPSSFRDSAWAGHQNGVGGLARKFSAE
jgi:hypothetical protein